MNTTERVLKIIPIWGDDGLTFEEIHSKLPGLPGKELKEIIKKLFESMKIESISCGNDPKKYRFCNGAQL